MEKDEINEKRNVCCIQVLCVCTRVCVCVYVYVCVCDS